MNTVSRGIRNAFRNSVRTLSIVIILGLSIGLALTMLVARQAVETKIGSVKASIGNTILVSPAGSRGFEGGGEPLTADEMAKVKALPHVTKVTETINDQLASTDTNLQSAIEAGSIGQRQNRRFATRQGGEGQTSFTPPVFAVGSTDIDTLQSFGGGTVTLTSGQKINPNSNDNVAMVAKDLADKNSLSVGSTFTAYGTTVTVKGIFDVGNRFGNNVVVFPLTTLQRLSGQTGDINSAIVQVDSITNLDTTTSAIKDALGSAADVVSQQDTSSQALAPLENIKNISLVSLIGAVAAGAVIILLTMIMIVRERRREVGVFKAIGASNLKVMLQFMTEALTFTTLGAAVGLGIGALAASPITQLLVSSSANSAGGGSGPGSQGGGFARIVGGAGRLNLRDVTATVHWTILLYGLLAAFVIAIVGSAVPAWLIAKVRPAEVMRSE